MDEEQARAAASTSSSLRGAVRLGDAQELTAGWYFPIRSATIGCNGIVVNKHTGKLFHLGSAFPVERDLALYDRGYQFDRYDLVITAVHKRRKTLHALGKLSLQVVEPTLEHGTVWRVPRSMTSAELSTKLDQLPCVFPAVKLYFDIEHLESARAAGWFTCEISEHVPTR